MSASCCLSSRRAVEPGALLLASRTPWQGVAHCHPSCALHHPPRPPATAAPPTLALPAPSHMRCGSGHGTGCGSAINVYYGDHHTACPHTGTWPGCGIGWFRKLWKIYTVLCWECRKRTGDDSTSSCIGPCHRKRRCVEMPCRCHGSLQLVC